MDMLQPVSRHRKENSLEKNRDKGVTADCCGRPA